MQPRAEMGSVPEVTLNSGHRMPVVGMGTACIPLPEPEVVKSAMISAIKLGYRHFDTAAIYQSEQPLGEAIAEALRLGLIKSRDELFIISKLWCNDAHQDLVLPALKTSLRNLQLDYLDLYLIHWPVSLKPGKDNQRKIDVPLPKEDLIPMDFKSVWAAMEECQGLGLTKSIGVSNFSCKKLKHILSSAKIPPAVNQVEMNPLWRQTKLIEFCKSKGIVVMAYSPLGVVLPGQGSKVMECEVLKEIAKARGKTHAQVCLRWIIEQGASLAVRSFNEERMKKNLEIFEWELSDEDNKKICQIPETGGTLGDFFISVDGPFKSREELWDGDI